MNSKERDRRRFLKGSVALAGVAMGGLRSARAELLAPEAAEGRPKDLQALHVYGERSHFVKSLRDGSNSRYDPHPPAGAVLDYGFRTPLQDSAGILTPNPLHYFISHGHEPPDIDPREHRLLIHGMVDRPLIFTLEELYRLPSMTRTHFVECNGNSSPPGGDAGRPQRYAPDASIQVTHGYTSCSEWTGVPLSVLLRDVGVKKGATWIVAEGAEEGKHSKSIPLEKVMDDVLVAYAQNGEPVRPEQGYPLRLMVPGWEGINSVKWLRRIKLVDQPYMGMNESTKYPSLRPDGKSRWFQFEMGPKSVITRPSGGTRLGGAGFHEITGLAWSGGGFVRRVEVSVDGGRTWKDAQLQEPVHRKAHSRFRLDWNWNGQEAMLQSRCTDERGEVQPTLAEFAKIWGVTSEFWQTTRNSVGHFNVIQPWKVTRDGSVHNAMFS